MIVDRIGSLQLRWILVRQLEWFLPLLPAFGHFVSPRHDSACSRTSAVPTRSRASRITVLLVTIEGVSFADRPAEFYLPVRETAAALGWSVSRDEVLGLTKVNGWPLGASLPTLPDGTSLVSLDKLRAWGARVRYDGSVAKVTLPGSTAVVVGKNSAKRVHIDLGSKELWAYQGNLMVMHCPVSPGRVGKPTPTGRYRAGAKEKMHWSTLYNSPMPFSVHLVGNIFIHGSVLFDDNVGSHGCIRLPVDTIPSYAEWFYNWIVPGTPVAVTRTRR